MKQFGFARIERETPRAWRKFLCLELVSKIGTAPFLKPLLAFVCAVSTGCGRSLPPYPPEAFSPQPVGELTASGELNGIRLSWRAPEVDRRGKELHSLNGYKIYRKRVELISDVENPDVEFETVAIVPDTHVEELERLREEARAQGKPAHRVRVEEAKLKFEYLDTSVAPGARYFYTVAPFNQGDVDGMIREGVRALYRGESSDVGVVTYIPSDGSSDAFARAPGALSVLTGR